MRTYLLIFLALIAAGTSIAQPGRDLEFKGEHPSYHFSDTFALVDYQYLEYVTDSVPPEDRVYVTYDTLEGILLNGHRCSVYEFPSILRYALANPARKSYFPMDESKATVMLLFDYPITNVIDYPPSFRTQTGQQFMLSTVLSVMYDVWNEDSRYAEDKTFALLNEEQRAAVVARNPHRIQWINFSDEYFQYVSPLQLEPEWGSDSTANYTEIEVYAMADEVLLVGETEVALAALTDELLMRMRNAEGKTDWPASPAEAVILLQHERETNFDFYLQVYDAVRAVYLSLWEEEAQRMFGRSYDDLTAGEQRDVRALLPMLIQESEPTPFEED